MRNYVDWVRLIALAQADQCGLSGLCRLLMERIGKTVFVTDKSGRVLNWQISSHKPIHQEEKIYIPASVMKSDDITQGIFTIKGQKLKFSCWPIAYKGTLGYLWVLPDDESLSAEEMEDIECVRSAMLVEITKRQQQTGIKQRLQDELIHNILFNNADSIDSIGQAWGWNLAMNYVVMTIEGVMKVHGRRVQEIRSQVEELLSIKHPGIIMGMIGNFFVVLLPIESTSNEKKRRSDTAWKTTARVVFIKLQEEISEMEFYAGVGNVHWNSSSLYRSYQEAKVALQLGKFTRDMSNIAFFNELGAIRLFYNQREQDLKDYFMEILGPVKKYDDETNGNLLLTLWNYYIDGDSIATTTAKMHIHVNTLRYRLRKVEDLLSVKLDDQEVRFNVYAALKVGIMIGIFR